MSIKAPAVLSEFTLVKFNVLDHTYTKTPSEAKAFVEGLQATTHETTLKFTDLVLCRSLVMQNTFLDRTRVKLENQKAVVIEQNNPKMSHTQGMCYLEGPLTAKEFIKMMEFKQGISPEAWNEHIDNFSYSKPKSKL